MQLNQEASALDWTKSTSHTLADSRYSGHDDLDMDIDLDRSLPHKLGGETSLMSAGARLASVAAAYHRLADSSTVSQESSALEVPDFDNKTGDAQGISSPVDDNSNQARLEPDPDDPEASSMNQEPYSAVFDSQPTVKPDSNDTEMGPVAPQFSASREFYAATLNEEPDPDDLEAPENRVQAPTVDSSSLQMENNEKGIVNTVAEPDPDYSEARPHLGNVMSSVPMNGSRGDQTQLVHMESNLDGCQETYTGQSQPDPDNKVKHLPQTSEVMTDEPDPDDEIKRIQDPAALFYNRLNRGIESLRTGYNHSEAMAVLQTLSKIIK